MQCLIVGAWNHLDHPFDIFGDGLHEAAQIVQRLGNNGTSPGDKQMLVTRMKGAKRFRHRHKWSLACDIFVPISVSWGTVCGSL